MRRRRGITLLEILTVAGVLAILAAILTPVFARARESAHRTTCAQNLKNYHLAIALYRQDEGRDGVYGTWPEMGLPHVHTISAMKLGLQCHGVNIIRCSGPSLGYTFQYGVKVQPPATDLEWKKYVLDFKDRAMLVVDQNHALSCPVTPLSLNRGIGITLAGNVITRIRRGDPTSKPWWHDTPWHFRYDEEVEP
ncbi:MAG TPA: type II secretion system protein [Fimbriimonadaceae bacterium]|nr:type II secretion system protein [Fimbriimonadaceae bacterium]